MPSFNENDEYIDDDDEEDYPESEEELIEE